MKILNGKKSTLIFQLDNGQSLRVPPGKFSEPFVGTLSMIRAITSSGTPSQVGFVVSNSYELSMLNDVPVASTYYYATEEEATKVILEGKDFSSVSETNPDMVRIAKLEAQVTELKTKCDEQKAYYENLIKQSDEKSSTDAEKVKGLEEVISSKDRDLQAKEVEVKALQSKIDELTKILESSKLDNSVLAEKESEIDTLNKALAAKDEDLKQALANNNSSELEAKVAELTKQLGEKSDEYEKLKVDAQEVFDRFEKAKAAVQHIMEKFHITYVDGEYMQTVN